MGHDHHARARCSLIAQEAEDLHTGAVVELAGRLVGEEESTTRCQSARDRDPLLFPTGQLIGKVIEPVAQADVAQNLLRGATIGFPPRDIDPELDVLSSREAGEEVEGLEDERDDRAPVREQLAATRAGDVVAIDDDPTARRNVERADHVEDRRLAAARRAEHYGELTGGNRERDVAQRGHRLRSDPVSTRNAVQGDDGRGPRMHVSKSTAPTGRRREQ